MRYDVTNINHYDHYPLCGFCMNAWDIVYLRMRTRHTTAVKWVEMCKVGGCDPDIWEYLDEDTCWPIGWPVGDNGEPIWEKVAKLPLPKPDNRCRHRRNDDSERAPWRKYGPRLAALASARVRGEKEVAETEEDIWDDPPPAKVAAKVALDDDIW